MKADELTIRRNKLAAEEPTNEVDLRAKAFPTCLICPDCGEIMAVSKLGRARCTKGGDECRLAGREFRVAARSVSLIPVEPVDVNPLRTEVVEVEPGAWLYRENASNHWRLTNVDDDGNASAGWISGAIPIERLDGEWKRPNPA